MVDTGKVMVGVRLEQADVARIDDLAQQRGESRAVYIRQLVEAHLRTLDERECP